MKKLVIFGMLFFGIMAMAEKLNTDGKDHLKELVGIWGVQGSIDNNIQIKIFIKNNKAYYQNENDPPLELKKYNNYTYYTDSYIQGLGLIKSCYSYDMKIKRLVHMYECGKDEWNDSLPRLLF